MPDPFEMLTLIRRARETPMPTWVTALRTGRAQRRANVTYFFITLAAQDGAWIK